MTIYSAVSHSDNKKNIFYLRRTTDSNEFYLAILPFEDEADSSFAQAASDMITKGDIDSIKRNETKEYRSTVSFIPANNFESNLLTEVSQFCSHELTVKTFLAVRMFIYDKQQNAFPFFGTIKHQNGIWKFIHEIQKNVFAYEHISLFDRNKNFIQPIEGSSN